MAVLGPHNITERERSREFISNEDVRLKAGLELPEEINPFTTQNMGIIERALAGNPVLARHPEARHKLMGPIQAGMARIALSRFGRGANVADEINFFQGVLNSLANTTGGGIAGDIVNLAQVVANIDPAIIAEEAKRRSEQDRKTQEEAIRITEALAAKATKKPVNWFSGEKSGGLGDLDPATYLRVMAYLKKRDAIASGNPALLAAAGIYYAAAYEGEGSGSSSSRSVEQVSLKQVSYMNFDKSWERAIEREIQRNDWRNEYEREQKTWPTGADNPVLPTTVTSPVADQAERIAVAKAQAERDRQVAIETAQRMGGVVDQTKGTVLVPGMGEFEIRNNQTVRVKDAAQLKQELSDREYLAGLGVANRWLPNPDGKTVTTEDGRVLRLNGDRQMTEIVGRQEAAQIKATRISKIQSVIPDEKRQSIAVREGIAPDAVTKDQIDKETHFMDQALPVAKVAAARDEVQQNQAILARQGLVDNRIAAVTKTVTPTDAVVQPVTIDGFGPIAGPPVGTVAQPKGTWAKTFQAWLPWSFKSLDRAAAVKAEHLVDPNPVVREAAIKESNLAWAGIYAGFNRIKANKLDPLSSDAQQHERSKTTYVQGAQELVRDYGTAEGLIPKALADVVAPIKPAEASWWARNVYESDASKKAREAAMVDYQAKLKEYEAKVGEREIERRMAAIRAADATPNEPPALPAALQPPKTVEPTPAVPVAAADPKAVPPVVGAPVVAASVVTDPAAKVTAPVQATALEATDPVVTGEAAQSRMPGVPASSARFRGLATPKNMSVIPASTLAAIRQHGAPLAAATQDAVVANQDRDKPAVEAAAAPTGLRSDAAIAEAERREKEAVPKDKPAEVSEKKDPAEPAKKEEIAAADKKDEKKTAEAAPAPAATAAPAKKEEEKKVAEATQVKKPAAPAVA